MSDTDLVFRQAPITGQPVDLLFGEVENLPDISVVVNGGFKKLTLQGRVGVPINVQIDGSFKKMSVTVKALYASATDRPLVARTATAWEQAEHGETGVTTTQQSPVRMPSGATTSWEQADKLQTSLAAISGSFDRMRVSQGVRYQDATRVHQGLHSAFQAMLHDRRQDRTFRHQDGVPLRARIESAWQERYHDRRPMLQTQYQNAVPLSVGRTQQFGSGRALLIVSKGRYQQAMRPPAGLRVPPVIPPADPCYIPSPHLLFADAPGDTNLAFICERHPGPPDKETVIVPIRSVYMMINNVTLRRVSNDTMLPALSLSMQIDSDSWTWGFSASLPAYVQSELEPDSSGQPVEVEVMVNGAPYRMLIEGIARERTFNRATISVTGRGKNAVLAAPYTPIMTFANSEERTAQQLMADVLTVNGVPLGWDIDWQLTDWLVPAGAFNVNGSYIDGLSAIVGAAGGYLQPHPTDDKMIAMLRYPSAPWEWGSVVPDYELPSAVTVREAIQWRTKPEYNQVYVSGQQMGVLGRVRRTGTAGDISAPMVTDPLITQAAAARQRGIAVLSDSGRQALVDLRLPVLEETGIITPGKFVRYVDGGDVKLGIVRGVSLELSGAELFQSINTETHV